MNILDLPLKAEWYDMIESGEKKEEYREIKPYWIKRLCIRFVCKMCDGAPEMVCFIPRYTHVRFRYGYTKRTMLFKLNSISVGIGRKEWGAPDDNVFILKLGERLHDTKH